MSDLTAQNYSEAVERFIAAAHWLDDTDLPGVMTLKTLAKHLDSVDGLPPAALVSQFTMTFRDLRNRAPKVGGVGVDPLAEELARASQPDLFTAAAEKWEREHGNGE